MIRDVIRSSGDESIAVNGMLRLSEEGLDVLRRRNDPYEKLWLEIADLAMKTLGMWTRERFQSCWEDIK